MKKILYISLLLPALIVSQLAASSNEVIYKDSQIWKAAHALCISNGVMPPSSVSPMTGYELKEAIGSQL